MPVGRCSEFAPSDDLVEALALLFGHSLRIGGIAYRNYCHGFYSGRQSESFGYRGRDEVAHPAGAELKACGCEAEVLDGYREVYVGVVFAVASSVPGFVMDAAGYYEFRGGAYPLAVVAAGDGFALFGRVGHEEYPGLAVAGRGGEAGHVEHRAEGVAAHGAVRVVAA